MKKLLTGMMAASMIFNIGAFSGSAQAKLDEHQFSKNPGLTFDVISDIQGDYNDFKHVLHDMKQVNPTSKALIVNGDITDRGWDFEYQAVQQVLDHNPHPENVWYSIGNHEFYKPKWATPNTLAQNTWPNHTPESEMFQNFYNFTGEEKVYHKKELDGYPFLFLGTEKYMHYHDKSLWDEVYLSDEQLDWLKQNLEEYSKNDPNKPVFLFSHHILKDSISGSNQSPYTGDYLDQEKLEAILKDYPQVILFTSHSHWDLNLPDWAGKKVVDGGDKRGFTVVNTAGIQAGWASAGPNGGEVSTGNDFKQGLQVEVNGNDVVIKAYDYKTDKVIKELGVHQGTVAQLPPHVEADDKKNELIGATQYMEYSVNGNGNGNGNSRWVDYDPKNPPKFEGNQNVFVRHKGEMNLEDGLSKKVTFKK
ncbi:DUF4073 domain-containing protein [Virgibacillus sp. LDC1]|nr:DUF4073 domain-containing protein [Virgibacillus sp. LDC1]